MDRISYARLTFTEFHAPVVDVYKTIAKTSIKCIGTQAAQL